MRSRLLVAGAVLVFGVVLNCFAQQRLEIRVRVTDVSGAELGGAHVLLRANVNKMAVSDVTATPLERRGEYSAALTPGVYDVFISAPCLVPFVTQIKVPEEKPETLQVQLKPQFNADSAYISGCPGPDDFGRPIDFDMYEPQLPDYIPFPTSAPAESEAIK